MDVVLLLEDSARAVGLGTLLDRAERYYDTDWRRKADARVADWPFMDSPLPTLFFILLYLLFVRVGPYLMQSRPPFQLRIFMAVYNFSMVLFNLYLGLEFWLSTRHLPNRFTCISVDYSNDPQSVRLAWTCWLYYVSKLIEFVDTVIFILRKKDGQVTFLHVYHHTTMFALWWVGVKWVAGGQSFFSAMVNSFVHVIMYIYYFLSGLGPSVQRFLWWKKYLTTVQLMQFFLMLFLCARSLFIRCDFPVGIQIAFLVYITTHVVLFSAFFNKTYRRPSHEGSLNGPPSDQIKTE